MPNEKKTDMFISSLLNNADIKSIPNGSDIKEIREALQKASKKGTGKQGFPDFTAVVEDFVLIIENKAELEKQVRYEDSDNLAITTDSKSITDYAENGALHYANKILEETSFKKIFAFGCSGEEKHYIIRPIYVDKSGYKLLDTVENFENFTNHNIHKYYKEQILGETPEETLELIAIIKKASELHEALRNYGNLGDAEKSLVVAAILFALSEKSFSIDSLIGDNVDTDGHKIFNALANHMTRAQIEPEDKKYRVLNQFNIIKDRPLLSQKDKRLGKTPLKYFTEYINKNILNSIISNTSEDVLGRFYGEFIRYSGGDGQTLGVVLTPKHITDLFCELIELKPSDKVFDPCCGTGGFLIAGMHKMLNDAKDENEKTKIKKENMHGIEIREDMFAIATTNMILRGDGKSNLINDNFLNQKAEDLKKENYTVGFINPPYSQAKGKDTVHLSEINFISHLLNSLAEGGRCVAIVPQSTMIGKRKEDKAVKKEILENHTLEGVITLNKNTFYGVGTNPCIAIFTAHTPHPSKKYCKFVNYEDDGFEVQKHIGLVEKTRAISRKSYLLDCWLHGKPAENKFMIQTPISPDDEWLHSFYYFNDEIPTEEDFEKTIADYLTFEFSMIMQGREYLFEEKRIEEVKNFKEVEPLKEKDWGVFEIGQEFDIKNSKAYHKSDLKEVKNKGISYVSRTNLNNGIESVVKDNDFKINPKNTIVFGAENATFLYQPNQYITGNKMYYIEHDKINKQSGLFIQIMLNKSIVDCGFGYGKGLVASRVKKRYIKLPISDSGKPDYEYMENYIKKLEYQKLSNYLKIQKL